MTLETERLEQIVAQLESINSELASSRFASDPEFRDLIRGARRELVSATSHLSWTLKFAHPDAVETRRPRAQVPQIARS